MFSTKLQSLLGSMKKQRIAESQYPAFTVIPQKITEIPEDKIYPLIRPYCHVEIRDKDYIVSEPQLSEDAKKVFEKAKRALMQTLDVSPSKVRDEHALLKMLQEKFQGVLGDFGIQVSPDTYLNMMYYVYRDFMGLNEIEPLLRDPFIEDISCDGTGVNLYIIHRRFGSLRTNIVFNDSEHLKDMVVKLAEKCGRYVSYAEPLVDGTLPDGTRLQATLAKDVTTRGPSFSIRKFPEKPYTPLDMMNFGTADSTVLAYLWRMVESGANILVIGATSSGKTSLLNSIAFFIPREAKVVSIEDTREINIMHENWLPAVARTSFSGTTVGEVTMFELLKESFRQNPNYIIVGEIRGEEANVMFQAMASGMSAMSTMHAGSAEDAVKRLQLPPILIPPSMMETLDIVIFMSKAAEISSNARRIRNIIEIGKDGKFDEVCFWNATQDSFFMKSESKVLKRLADERGASEEFMAESMKKKEKFLESLKGKSMGWEEVADKIKEFRHQEDIENQRLKTMKKTVSDEEKYSEANK